MSAADTGLAFPVGTTLGSYRLLEQIGVGGMGRVFVAEHVRLGRKVALKLLRSEYSGNIEAVKRFFAEARAVNRINHENIIEVSDFIENPGGASYYIMELLHGTLLRTLQDREGPLPLPRAINIALQVCRGVGAAHDAGVIHRDLKPDNIFLIERDGRRDFVKLLDFGVAKLSDATLEDASTFKTSAGIVVGTPDYMAPEQALGNAVDHRCDLYSLGVILFEMVAGRLPFVARTAREVMVQHMTATPPRPSQLNPAYNIPVELEDLILDCLRKEPQERPANIKEVEQRLQLILDDFITGDTDQGLRFKPKRHVDRWLAAVGVTLLLASGGFYAWSKGYRPDLQVAEVEAGKASHQAPRGGEDGAGTGATRLASTQPTTPGLAPAAAGEEVASTAERAQMTVELQRVSGPTLPATVRPPVERTAEPASARPARPAAPPPRRKPPKLDRDSVLNPFE
ncbi:MAG TPA: serine/threonine-protein kinase [Polyangia bacterium]|nr:serine/threonine-protein kinase [Polyangia bacterium]